MDAHTDYRQEHKGDLTMAKREEGGGKHTHAGNEEIKGGEYGDHALCRTNAHTV